MNSQKLPHVRHLFLWVGYSLLFACGLSKVSAFPESHGAGVTIVTHGFQPSDGTLNQDNNWVKAMGDYIADRAGGTPYVYDLVISGQQFPIITPPYVKSFQLTRQNNLAPISNSNRAEIIVKVYWDDIAGGIAWNPLVPERSADEIAELIFGQILNPIASYLTHPLAHLPIHLIGHSRGSSVVSNLTQRLGQRGIWVDQMTTLDPRPVWPDPEVRVYENVLFADNYYVDRPLTQPHGAEVSDAYNRHLNDNLPGGYGDVGTGNHSDVHLWYHGTVNLNDGAWDGGQALTASLRDPWYSSGELRGAQAGFFYSRLGNGDRTSFVWPTGNGDLISQGYHHKVGGGAFNRVLFSASERAPASEQWPNLITVGHAGGSFVTLGTPITVSFKYQTYSGQSTADFYWDTDQNPYNNQSATRCNDSIILSQTGAAIPPARSFPASTQDLSAGTLYYICGRIQANGKSRFLYDPQPVVMRTPVIVPTAPTAPSSLIASAVSSSQVNLTWSVNSSNESGFKIERRTTGTFAQIKTVAARIGSYSDTGLSADTTYSYRVRAYNSEGDSAYSNTASAKTIGLANAVRSLIVMSVNPSGVNFNYSPSPINPPANGVLSYYNGTQVTLTAPLSANGNSFVRWEKDGVALTSA